MRWKGAKHKPTCPSVLFQDTYRQSELRQIWAVGLGTEPNMPVAVVSAAGR